MQTFNQRAAAGLAGTVCTMCAVELTEKQRRHLKGLAHNLNPVIRVGNGGVSPAVVAETRRALSDHELIKVRVAAADRAERDAAIGLLSTETTAALVARIGHVAILYLPHPDQPRILLPAADR
jgi:RNA-binding protein